MTEPSNVTDVHRRTRIREVCNEAVQSSLNARLDENNKDKIRRNLYAYLLREIANAASEQAISTGTDPDDFELLELPKALAIVDELRSAFVRDWSDKTLNFWDNVERPLDKIRANKVPYIDRSTVESVVGSYLALPYRCNAIDRFLTRVLIGMELYAFGDEMLNEKTFGLFPAKSPLKRRHALAAYLIGLATNCVFFGGIAALGLWMTRREAKQALTFAAKQQRQNVHSRFIFERRKFGR